MAWTSRGSPGRAWANPATQGPAQSEHQEGRCRPATPCFTLGAAAAQAPGCAVPGKSGGRRAGYVPSVLPKNKVPGASVLWWTGILAFSK